MPTILEVKSAAKTLAEHAREDCPPSFVSWLADHAARRPQDWGFPRSYSSRPNWTMKDLRREISLVLWGLPTHPTIIAPEYRGLPLRILCEIYDGRISSLWWNAPSSRMRHEWLSSISCNRKFGGSEWRDWLNNPWTWVVRHCSVGGFIPRSRAIAEWLVAKKSWIGWNRPLPVGYGPDGTMVTVRPQDLLDEVWDDDLVNGSRSNPERVFRGVMDRKGSQALADIARENAAFPTMPWSTIPGVEQIKSARALVAHGDDMQHCVGSYAEACRTGYCFILRLPNSTAEITPDGSVYQHRSRNDSDPSPSDKSLLARWVSTRKMI